MVEREESANPGGSRAQTATSRLDRRTLLLATAVAGSSTIGSLAGVVASDEHDGRMVEVPEDDEWEERADERIRAHRTAELVVEVTTPDGDPVPDADVTVEMTEHAFDFGTAVNAGTLIEETSEGDEYREYIPELFNTAVLENQHKWRFFEEDPDLADDTVEWLLDRGLDLRGHACLWGSVDSWAVPPDVVEAMGIEWEDGGATDPDPDPEHVRERSFAHVEEIISHYGDDITEWDVVNEVVHEPGLITAIDGSNVNPMEAPVLAEWYEHAQEVADSVGAGIAVNDYDTLEGPTWSTRRLYETQIEYLESEGIDLDGIGLQCHFGANSRLEPAQIVEGLNLYAQFDAAIRITEFDTYQGDWGGDEAKATFLHEFLKTAFSHPATESFIMWGFWDGRHWRDDAPLFYEDWEPKPAYDVYTGLVFDEWWTEERGQTDDRGRFESNAFKGSYEVAASYDGETEAETAILVDGGTTVRLELDVDTGTSESNDSVPGFGTLATLGGVAGAAGYLHRQVTTGSSLDRPGDE